jgi:hypothetical protein
VDERFHAETQGLVWPDLAQNGILASDEVEERYTAMIRGKGVTLFGSGGPGPPQNCISNTVLPRQAHPRHPGTIQVPSVCDS